MTTEDRLAAMRDWFHQHEGVGLELPDGWFGRPYDNVHQITNISLSKGELHITFDDRIKIAGRGSSIAGMTASELRLLVDHLKVEWTGFGSKGVHHTKTFEQALLVIHSSEDPIQKGAPRSQ